MRLIATVGRKLAILGERNRAIAKRARAASRAKSTFLATMSHEIRTPLNGIIGTAELMAHAHLSPEQERHLSTIRESGYHLLEVISDVLDFSKLESGKVEFEIHRVRLPDVAMLLRAMLAPRAELKGLRLGIDLPALEVGTDPARLRQILVNLLGNALKFTTEGSVTATGRLTAPGRLRIEIADTGIGIPDAAMSLLFRDFSQVDGSASRSFGGTGLGLVICKRIAEGLGGRIGATSRPGEGSTFWFEIPVADPLPVEAAAATPPDPAHAREGAFQGRVLVVEDNPVNRTVAKGLLGWLGVEVEMAHNGAQAVERLAQGGCDLVLMDVQMPVMNGLEATEEIRRRGDPVRIVGLTGNAFISDRADCLRAGMDDFVAKPVTQDKLAQVLAEAGLQRPAGPAAKQSPEARPAPGGRSAPGPGAAPEAPLLDAGLFASLLGTLGAGTVEALLEEVMAEAAALPAAFAEGEAGDSGRLDAILHGFKGAAATLGLAEAARLAQALRDGGGRGPEATERPLRAALAGADMARAALRAAGRPVAA
nr:ATP-binding protein [Rubellimicrobium aerolatum]